MTAELRVGYRPDDEWVGELDAAVTSGGFSGQASAWFDRTTVKETFVTALRAFPLSTNLPPVLQGGFWSKEKSGTLDQCHLRIAIRPHGHRGALLVQVDLATPVWRNPDDEMHHSATVRFLTTYMMVGTFASELEEVLDGRRDCVVLKSADLDAPLSS
jgi:hypothetical protein